MYIYKARSNGYLHIEYLKVFVLQRWRLFIDHNSYAVQWVGMGEVVCF